jgi:PadR family transcriptional regulator, regulatory protein PadR
MTASRVRLTKPTLAVLDVLLAADPDDPVWGFRICEEADLGSGSVYPILERLERVGWLSGSWEDPPPAGRPRRRFYTLSGGARQEIAAALAARAASRRHWLPGPALSAGPASPARPA